MTALKNFGLLEVLRGSKTSKIKIQFSICLIAIVCFGNASELDEYWPGFRGPRFNGSSGTSGLPVSISKLNFIKWKIDLPGQGSSTPIVWGDYAFITSENRQRTEVIATKVNIWTGQTYWQHSFSKVETRDRRSDMAAPTPTTNGKEIIFMSGSGDLVAYNFAGHELWRSCLLYTSPSPRDQRGSRMPSSA